MNVGSKHSIDWNNSGHGPSWWFDLRSGIGETGSPGIGCIIICHQVLRHPSAHGSSPMGKHLLPKVHIARMNKVTQSEVTKLSSSMVDETTLAILKRQASQGITLIRLQRKFILVIPFLSILTQLIYKTLQTCSQELCKCLNLPRQMESLPHVRICSGSYSMECYNTPGGTTIM